MASRDYFGGGSDILKMMQMQMLKEMFKTPEEKESKELSLELKRLQLKGARDPHTLLTVDKRLTSMANQFDLTTSEGIEKAVGVINTAIEAGKFGTNEQNIEHAKAFSKGLVKSSTLTSDIVNLKKELSTSINYSNLDATLKNALLVDDKTGKTQIKTLENFAYDLSTNRDRLEELGSLNPAIDKRYQKAIQKINLSIQEFGGDGLSPKEWERIKTGTYATIKQAEANLEQEFIFIDKVRKFKSPTLKDEQLLNSLTAIHTQINEYDDYSAQMGNKLLYSGMMQPEIAGTPSPQMEELAKDLSDLEIFRDDRVLNQYAESYQKMFDLYVKNRKDNEGKFELSDFREIMDSRLHEELYNFKLQDDGVNNNQFNPYQPKEKTQKSLINNMFTKRNITFTDDVVDEYGKIWMQKGKTLEGMGKSGKDSWQIKNINRTDTGELKNIVLEIPNYDMPQQIMSGYGLTPQSLIAKPSSKTVTLTPDNFILEDAPNFSGPGYKSGGKWGLTSYNIFNNFYEQVK